MEKCISTEVPALPRDTYHVCLAIYIDSIQSYLCFQFGQIESKTGMVQNTQSSDFTDRVRYAYAL